MEWSEQRSLWRSKSGAPQSAKTPPGLTQWADNSGQSMCYLLRILYDRQLAEMRSTQPLSSVVIASCPTRTTWQTTKPQRRDQNPHIGTNEPRDIVPGMPSTTFWWLLLDTIKFGSFRCLTSIVHFLLEILFFRCLYFSSSYALYDCSTVASSPCFLLHLSVSQRTRNLLYQDRFVLGSITSNRVTDRISFSVAKPKIY